MNLLELVSAITGQGQSWLAQEPLLSIGRLFSKFPFLNKGEKVWEVRAKRKGEVATDILGQAFYFLMFIQCIKNKFKTACRKAFSDLWHTVPKAQVVIKNQLWKRMFPAFEIHRTQSLSWHDGQATYRDSTGVFTNNPTSRKTTLPAEAKCLSPSLSRSSYKLIPSAPSGGSRYLFWWNKKASKN